MMGNTIPSSQLLLFRPARVTFFPTCLNIESLPLKLGVSLSIITLMRNMVPWFSNFALWLKQKLIPLAFNLLLVKKLVSLVHPTFKATFQ
ncbi:MAG: hypothetical protein [Cressdnaviricota sp.]|nr:MAG: hypothetical protein [Cressdnaviricota sp.]